MSQGIEDLYINSKGGIQLCIFRRLSPADFRVSADQLVVLILLNILLDVAHDFFASFPNPSFNPHAIPGEGLSIVLLVLSCYIIDRLIFRQEVTASLSVFILSLCPPIMMVWLMGNWLFTTFLHEFPFNTWVGGIYSLWVFAVLLWSIRTLVGGVSKKVAMAFVLLLVIWLGPSQFYAADSPFWTSEENEVTEEDPYEAYRALDVEEMYYTQPQLLTQALGSLHSGQTGHKDIFFLGFGGWAFQDVFLKETMYAKDLFDHRFESQNRSLVLVNHLSTHEILPLATSHNLQMALKYIGARMNWEEDLLILYMTSHGSKDHTLSVNFWPLQLNDISPDMLRQYLDEAGIKWRVIMVSACYSGGFIEPLKTPFTAIATAAAPNRQSFGCGNKSEFTYFGEALLKDQLQEVYSFPLAFSGAIQAIGDRESRENLDASFPQSFIGDGIKSYLQDFTLHLQRNAQIKMARGH